MNTQQQNTKYDFLQIPEEDSPLRQPQNNQQTYQTMKLYQNNSFDEEQDSIQNLVDQKARQNEIQLREILNRPNLLKKKLEDKKEKTLIIKRMVDQRREQEKQQKIQKFKEDEQKVIQKAEEKKQAAMNLQEKKRADSLKSLFEKKLNYSLSQQNQRKILQQCGLKSFNFGSRSNSPINNSYSKDYGYYTKKDTVVQSSIISPFDQNYNYRADTDRFSSGQLPSYKNKELPRKSITLQNNIQKQQQQQQGASQISIYDKNFPLNSIETRNKILDYEKTNELYKLPGFGIEKTPLYQINQQKNQEKKRLKVKQSQYLGSQTFQQIKSQHKSIDFQNIYNKVKSLKKAKAPNQSTSRYFNKFQDNFDQTNIDYNQKKYQNDSQMNQIKL